MLEELKEISDVVVKKTDANVTLYYQDALCNILDFMKDFYPRLVVDTSSDIDVIIPGLSKRIDNDINFIVGIIFQGLLVVERNNKLYSFDLSKAPTRAVSDSIIDSESPFLSRDGFVEAIKINIALIRTRVKDVNLKIDSLVIGRRSKTNVCVFSIKDIHDEKILNNIIKDLKKLDVDAILNPDDLTEAFSDNKLFLGYQYVGSACLAARRLYNGEFVILIDRLAIALILPISIGVVSRMPIENINIPLFTALERSFVFICFFISTLFLGLITSFTTFQSDMLSLRLLSIIKATQKGVVLPVGLEIIICVSLFELFELIAYRQSKQLISGAILLIGGIVISENLITSGIAGVFIITMAAISFLSGFIISTNVTVLSSISIVRLLFIFSSYYFGLYGVISFSLVMAVFLYNKKLYGVHYFYPFLPFSLKGIYRFLLSTSSKKNKRRNIFLARKDKVKRK